VQRATAHLLFSQYYGVIMPVKTMLKVFPLVLFCCMPFFPAAAQQPLTPAQLVEAANAASDLSRLGSYRLKAIVAVGENKHGATGTLTVDHDQENTRQELEFTDYHELGLVRGDTGYFRRSPAISLYVAERIHNFDELWWVSIPPESEIGSVSPAKVHGAQALCFTVKPSKFESFRYCFDAATHLLLSRFRHAESDLEIQFLNYQELDGVHFPGTIHFFEPERAAMEVIKVTAVKMPFDAANFAPLEGARGFHTCRHLVPPRSVKRVDPHYPSMARIGHISGDVRLAVKVGEDGKIENIRVLSGHPMLTEAAVAAAKQWEYLPATCPSGPVEDESIVTIRFHMGARPAAGTGTSPESRSSRMETTGQ
jgi:TonB family protein